MPKFLRALALPTYVSCGSENIDNDGNVSPLCVLATLKAAHECEIPGDVFVTLAQLVPGSTDQKYLQSWPWAVYMEGESPWYSSHGEALILALERRQNGAASFDIGCFQINYRRHRKIFESIENIFEPILSFRYAACFLTKLYLEFGSWAAVAGAFHSGSSSIEKFCTGRFDKIQLNLNALPPELNQSVASIRSLPDGRKNLISSRISIIPPISKSSPELIFLFPILRSFVGNGRIVYLTTPDR